MVDISVNNLTKFFVIGENLLQGNHFLLNLHQIRIGGAKHVLHGESLRKNGNLRDETQPLVGIDIYFAIVKINLPGQDPEKRGLAAAVSAEEAVNVPVLDIHVKTAEHLEISVALAQISYPYHIGSFLKVFIWDIYSLLHYTGFVKG